MTESVTLQFAPSSAAWVLHPPTDPWGDGYVAVMTVELRDSGLDARKDVTLSWPPDGVDQDLVIFLQGLADDWRGWSGERTWRSLDGDLWIDACHDGQGHVLLGATLRGDSTSSDAWSARVVLTVEAGEQLTHLVAELRALLCRST
jgi:hypothetical protein